ncbi:inositol monophosphatase, partial [Pseudomonas oryzihabitans]
MSLTAAEISYYERFAERLTDAAAVAIQPYFRAQLAVDDKGDAASAGRRYDPVTIADKAAERAMRELIQAEHPDHGILGEEEENVAGESPLTWVLDPIDGTRAFITGLPLWGTLVALNDGSRPVVGVMNQPFTGERYLGTPAGAWRNGVPLHTRPCTSLAQARLMC